MIKSRPDFFLFNEKKVNEWSSMEMMIETATAALALKTIAGLQNHESSRAMVSYTRFVGLICRYDFHIFSLSPLSNHSISKMLCANYNCTQTICSFVFVHRHFCSILLACEVHIISLCKRNTYGSITWLYSWPIM